MNDMKDIGKSLVEHAKEAEAFSAHRGVMDELFPFIFEASKRMSLRAIGRWLLSEHQISVSPNTLARAMRNPGKYWIQILEEIEPAVRIVARAHDVSPAFVLSSDEVVRHLEMASPILAGEGEDAFRNMQEYEGAVNAVKGFWNWMPMDAMTECLAYVGKVFEDEDDKEKEKVGGQDESTGKRTNG